MCSGVRLAKVGTAEGFGASMRHISALPPAGTTAPVLPGITIACWNRPDRGPGAGAPARCRCKRADAIGRATLFRRREAVMSVDADTVRRIAHLARLNIADEEIEHLKGERNAILAFVDQLSEVAVEVVEGVEPMTSVMPMRMKQRPDVVTDGGDPEAVLKNAPAREDNFFLVPKVVE